MAAKYNKYTNDFKHNVLQEYRHGIYEYRFRSLPKLFAIENAHKLMMSWYVRRNGTTETLELK